jgi:hypothetical protein
LKQTFFKNTFTLILAVFVKVILFTGALISTNAYAQGSFAVKNDPSIVFGDLDLSQESPLYREILSYMDIHHRSIAERQLREVEEGRGLNVWGGLNHVGLRFNKGFGTFGIELRRQVAPDLFDDERWLVTDTFDIQVDASQLLNRLKNEDVIDISEQNLALFAGLTFKRSYTHVHFADSYEKALGFNLDKLFYGFQNFRNIESLELAPDEFIKKEDSLGMQAGGLGSIPVTTGLAAHVGALMTYQRLATVTLQGVSVEEQSFPGERLRLSREKTKEITLGARAGLVADFIGLLQISLLSFDFSYSLSETYKQYMSLSQGELNDLEGEGRLGLLKDFLKHREIASEVLAPYRVTEEQRRLETSRFKYQALLFGGKRDLKTEYIKIVKEGLEHVFFRHHFEKENYRQNFFSRLFFEVIKKVTQLSSLINKAYYDTEKVRLEYRHKRNLILTQEDLILEAGAPKLSINFMKGLYSHRVSKKVKKRILDFLDHFSGADPLLARQVENGQIKSSVRFNTTFTLDEKSLEHFHSLSTKEVYEVFDDSCKASRSGLKGWLSGLLKICERSLKKSFDQYDKERRVADYSSTLYNSCKKDLKRYRRKKRWLSSRRKRAFLETCLQRKAEKKSINSQREIPVWQLARLMRNIHKRIPSKVHHYQLFGFKNVHIHGQFSGLKRDGYDFDHFFKEGLFRGTGVVSNSLKLLKVATPESSNSF